MEIIKAPSRQSMTWRQRLMSMEVGDHFHVEVAAAGSVSSRISDLKAINPDKGWNWSVSKIRDPKSGDHTHATVTRTA